MCNDLALMKLRPFFHGAEQVHVKSLQDSVDGFVQEGAEFGHADRLLLDDAAVCGSAHQFDNGKKEKLGLFIGRTALGEEFPVGLSEMVTVVIRVIFQKVYKDAHGQIFMEEIHQGGTSFHPVQYVIHKKMDLRLKAGHLCFEHGNMGIIKQFLCLVHDQLGPDVIFVLEIQIERTFCNTCLIYDVGDRRLGDALSRKQFESGLIESVFFHFLINFYFSHICTSIQTCPFLCAALCGRWNCNTIT